MRALLPLVWLAVACSDPGSTNRPFVDAGADTILVPTDALFPQDTLADAPAEIAAEVSDTIAPDTIPPDTFVPDTTLLDTATAPPDTTSPDSTIDTADTSSCPSGMGCNDNDPCTVNDHCQDGVCVGGGPTCSDGLPCTTDVCQGGVCSFPIQAGSCSIGGVCYAPAQPNPADACQRCEPGKSPSDWFDIPDCGLGVACDYHTDCYPERVCARWVTTGETVCSDPCAGAADCKPGQICSKMPGSAQVGFCQDPMPDTLVDGEACTEDYQCRSGMCGDGACRPLCLDEAHCTTPGYTCHPVGDLAAGVVASVCAPDPPGAILLGQVCSPDGGNTFDGAYCASGHCDLYPYPSTALPCSPICKSELDCAPAQECNLVLYATTRSPTSVPYDPLFSERTYESLTACYNPLQFGPKQVGAPCTDRAQCGSNKCLGLIPNDPTTYCTSFCEFDAECPSGMECKLEALNLASMWLNNPLVSGQGVQQTSWTFVRVCKFE